MTSASPSLIFVGRGSSTSSGVGSGTGSGAGVRTATGVEAFLRDDCGAASETRRFAGGSRRSRAGSLRFSAMAAGPINPHSN